MKMIKTISLSVMFFLISSSAMAEVFKWTDEQGNVHYGARPPTGQSANQVRIDAAPPADPYLQQRRENMMKQLDANAEERQEKKKQQAKTAKEKAEKKKRCQNARSRLSMLEGHGRVYTTDANGERSYYSSEQLERNREQARRTVREHCS